MEAVTAEASLFVYARKQLGLSQRKMAMRLGINQSSISKIEGGVHRPRISSIRKLERLMREPAERLACLAMGKPVPDTNEPSKAPKALQQEVRAIQHQAKVIKMNHRYREMDTEGLEYLKSKFYTQAYELDRKAGIASYQLKQKALKHKLHRLTMENLEQKHQEANDLHAYLLATHAPDNLQAHANEALDEATSHLKTEKHYGIYIPTATDLALEQMRIDEMHHKVELLRIHMLQVESILLRRKQPQIAPKGRLVPMPDLRKVYRGML